MSADIERVCSFLTIPPDVVQQQQWQTFLNAVLTKAQEFDKLKADKVYLEVESEQAKRQSEKRIAKLRDQVDATRKEVDELNASREANDANSQDANSTSRTELDACKVQLGLLETTCKQLTEDKRQTLSLVERQNQAAARQEEDYKALSQRYDQLHRDLAENEAQVQQARTSESAVQVSSHSKQTNESSSFRRPNRNSLYLRRMSSG